MNATDKNITFHPIGEKDMPFLNKVYAGTRAEELAPLDWTEKEKKNFLDMQFNAQHKYYQENYVDSVFLVISEKNAPVGRLYLARWEMEFRIIDISLLPEHRNKGIGSGLLKDIIKEAAEVGKPVSIHVESFNRALKLYERLGFKKINTNGVYYLMEWPPGEKEKHVDGSPPNEGPGFK